MSRPNRFPCWCRRCGAHVPAGEGHLACKTERGWTVYCADCHDQILADARDEAATWYDATYGPWCHHGAEPHVPACVRTLGLSWPTTPELVRRRFRALAMTTHPDRGGDPGRFIEVRAAYGEAMSLIGGGR